ncbi:MAG: hypothetical protein OJF49_001456 [Ktedonobacterales bacterium]|nr:MAG: hypothetical protein OJF49_001456 [Ktedonobacterales bacterium]
MNSTLLISLFITAHKAHPPPVRVVSPARSAGAIAGIA